MSTTNATTGITGTLQYSGAGNSVASDGSHVYSRAADGSLLGVNTVGGTTASGQLLLTDQHTDVVGDFTAGGGSLAGSAAYDPFGSVLGTDTVSGTMGFQSEYTDTGSGEVNMDARWYSPKTGQFASKDTASNSPMPDSASANPFGYGGDDPLDAVDPSGHHPEMTGQGLMPKQDQITYQSPGNCATQLCHDELTQEVKSTERTEFNVVQDASAHCATKSCYDQTSQDVGLIFQATGGSFTDGHGTETDVTYVKAVATAEAAYEAAKAKQPYPTQVKVYTNPGQCGRFQVDCTTKTVTVTEYPDQGDAKDFWAGMGGSVVSLLDSVVDSSGPLLPAVIPGGSLTSNYDSWVTSHGVDTESQMYSLGNAAGVALQIVLPIGVGELIGLFSTAADAADAVGTAADATGATAAGETAADATAATGADATAVSSGVSADVAQATTEAEAGAGGDALESAPDSKAPSEGEPEKPPCTTCPCHSFVGDTQVLMADGSTKPIDQVKVGDEIADAVPGQTGTQGHAVTAVIVTKTDHDFVDVTVTPTAGGSAAKSVQAAEIAPTVEVAGKASSSTRVTMSKLAKAAVGLAAGLAALAVGVVGGSAHGGASATRAGAVPVAASWSEDSARPSGDSLALAAKSVAGATSAAQAVGGGTLTTTFHHPFYDETQTAFVQAQYLHVGDILQTTTGTARVTDVHLFHANTTTYDLTIGTLHTFYVVAGNTPVLVHNCDGDVYGADGSIRYHALDADGRATGVSASISPDMLDTGTGANGAIQPSGWSGDGTAFNEARGHLLADRLGGSGDLEENLVTLTQDPINTPIMRDEVEGPIYNAVQAGETVQYNVRAVYAAEGDYAPIGLQIDAYGSQGFSLSRYLPNPAGNFSIEDDGL